MSPDIVRPEDEVLAAKAAPKSAEPDSAEPKSTLHVLTLTPFFPSAGDEATGCFIAESTRQLQQVGVKSSVIAVSPLHHPQRAPSPSAPSRWVRYPQIPGNLGLSNAGRWLYARLLAEAPRLHKKTPIGIIHAHAALPCGHAAALLSRHLKVPFVVTVHGLDVFNNCFTAGIPAQWRRNSSVDVYRAARTVICISEKVERLLRGGMPQPVRSQVVYNGTDTNLFTPAVGNESNQENEILLVGTMLAGKGQELVLRAMSQLRDSFPNLRCRFIGEGAERPQFEALANELGIAQRVYFEGRKTRAEIANAMRACSIFVLPSRFEGLGCVYLEAMACGKPVIGCRGQGIDEIIEHGKNGWLIPTWVRPTDGVDELVQGLSTLLQSPELRERIGASARETILNGLTLSHQAQRLAQIYSEAIMIDTK